MPSKASAQRYRARRISAGLCVDCGAVVGSPQHRCQKCRKHSSEKASKYAANRAANGLCIRCGASSTGHLMCDVCRPKSTKEKAAYRERIWNAVVAGYGGACACCGERTNKFLTVDHINGGGGKERRETKTATTAIIVYRKFQKSGLWPSEYRLLCYNCNCGTWRNGGTCPHMEM